MKFSKASIALLLIHLAIVSTVAAKYLYQRSVCPRVWTRANAYDPSLVSARPLPQSAAHREDGCSSTLPSKRRAFPRNLNGLPRGNTFSVRAATPSGSRQAAVKDNKLMAIRVPESDTSSGTQTIAGSPGASCNQMRLSQPVNFYIPNTPPIRPYQASQELWIEVTIPPKGPPRPLQLALKNNGVWKPLAFQ